MKKLSKSKKIGIILLVLQVLGIVAGIPSGTTLNVFAGGNYGTLVGFCLPGIIGLVLLIVKDKKAQNGDN